MLNVEKLHEQVLLRMDLTKDPTDDELQELIHDVLEEHSKEKFIPLKDKAILGKEIFNALRKLDILQELIVAVIYQTDPAAAMTPLPSGIWSESTLWTP